MNIATGSPIPGMLAGHGRDCRQRQSGHALYAMPRHESDPSTPYMSRKPGPIALRFAMHIQPNSMMAHFADSQAIPPVPKAFIAGRSTAAMHGLRAGTREMRTKEISRRRKVIERPDYMSDEQ
jgi:hypothetical protein